MNITHFIKNTLGLTSEDTVIVKMDVEGVEWPILEGEVYELRKRKRTISDSKLKATSNIALSFLFLFFHEHQTLLFCNELSATLFPYIFIFTLSSHILLLSGWMSDPEMPKIVDELFVEIHYRDESMALFGWDKMVMPNGTAAPERAAAVDLFQNLRKVGFYVHAWP